MLYNLQYALEDNCKAALTKTVFTKEADKEALKTFLGRILKLK